MRPEISRTNFERLIKCGLLLLRGAININPLAQKAPTKAMTKFTINRRILPEQHLLCITADNGDLVAFCSFVCFYTQLARQFVGRGFAVSTLEKLGENVLLLRHLMNVEDII